MKSDHVHCDNIKKFAKEFAYTDKFCLPSCKPPISRILHAEMEICHIKKETICTCSGLVLAVSGIKIINICYESCGCCNEIVKNVIKSPFFEIIPLNPCMNICNICVKPCYCKGYICGKHEIYVNSVICISASSIINNKPHHRPPCSRCMCKKCSDGCKNPCKCFSLEQECHEMNWDINDDCW